MLAPADSVARYTAMANLKCLGTAMQFDDTEQVYGDDKALTSEKWKIHLDCPGFIASISFSRVGSRPAIFNHKCATNGPLVSYKNLGKGSGISRGTMGQMP